MFHLFFFYLRATKACSLVSRKPQNPVPCLQSLQIHMQNMLEITYRCVCGSEVKKVWAHFPIQPGQHYYCCHCYSVVCFLSHHRPASVMCLHPLRMRSNPSSCSGKCAVIDVVTLQSGFQSTDSALSPGAAGVGRAWILLLPFPFRSYSQKPNCFLFSSCCCSALIKWSSDWGWNTPRKLVFKRVLIFKHFSVHRLYQFSLQV